MTPFIADTVAHLAPGGLYPLHCRARLQTQMAWCRCSRGHSVSRPEPSRPHRGFCKSRRINLISPLEMSQCLHKWTANKIERLQCFEEQLVSYKYKTWLPAPVPFPWQLASSSASQHSHLQSESLRGLVGPETWTSFILGPVLQGDWT